ncbi:hypothetical protein DYQ86_02690 [Acidobacteria bacterium AB60]|nr:hypothetical protein DYQ86_02690 [Acidobacteria bacterium AB60]
MKSALFLRIASVLTVVHAVLHTIGGVFGSIQPGPATVAVTAMKANQFMAMGHLRSYWDFFRGMGLAMTIAMMMEAIVMWQLGALAKTEAARLRPITATFLVGYLVLSVNSNRYFFSGPVIVEIVIALCLAAAIGTAKAPVRAVRPAIA